MVAIHCHYLSLAQRIIVYGRSPKKVSHGMCEKRQKNWVLGSLSYTLAPASVLPQGTYKPSITAPPHPRASWVSLLYHFLSLFQILGFFTVWSLIDFTPRLFFLASLSLTPGISASLSGVVLCVCTTRLSAMSLFEGDGVRVGDREDCAAQQGQLAHSFLVTPLFPFLF